MKYKELSRCQAQCHGHTQPHLRRATAAQLLGLLGMIPLPQHLPPRARRTGEEQRSPPKVYAKGGEGEEMRREKEENQFPVPESAQ